MEASSWEAGPKIVDRDLEMLGFVGESEAGKRGSGTEASHFHTKRGIGLRADLAEHGKSGESFVVNLCNQIGFSTLVLPDLAALHFASAHVYECSHIPARRQYTKPGQILQRNSRQGEPRFALGTGSFSQARGNYLRRNTIKGSVTWRPALGVYNPGRVLRRFL